jgi:tetratricopeptide (TPR) repeat protein
VLRVALVAIFLLVVDVAPLSHHVSSWLSSGEQAEFKGDYQAAQVSYGRVLERLGPSAEIYERLVKLSLNAEQYDAARVYLYALAGRDGWNSARREQLRFILEQLGETDQVAALLHRSLEENPTSPRVLLSLAHYQIGQLDWENARLTLETLLARQPDHPRATYLLGLLLAPTDSSLARYYLQQVIDDPEFASDAQAVLATLDVYGQYSLTNAHTYLGITLVGLGQWPFAERAFELALEANSVNPTALAYVGFTRDQQGRDGLPDIEAALAMSPNDPTLYYLLGLHWRLADDHAAAYDAFVQAYWLAPTNPALAAEVGTSLQNLRDLDAAEEWFSKAVTLAPDDIQWRRLQAAFYADTGYALGTGGLEFIQQTHELAPDDLHVWTSLGWAYYQLDDVTKAFEELNAVIGKNPADPRSRYYFAVVLERRGDKDGAADSYWYVLQQLGPDSSFGVLAARALRRLGYAAS